MPRRDYPDEAHAVTDVLLSELEARLQGEYQRAVKDIQAKLEDYLRRFQKKDEVWRKRLAAGEISRAEYNDWRTGQILIGQRWTEMRDALTADLRNTDKIARSIVDSYTPEAYALNHNYATFTVERDSLIDTSYSLYTREAVERIMRDDPDLLPPPGPRVNTAIAEGRAMRWERQQVQSVMLQGIVQGESIPDLARRVSSTLEERNLGNCIRYARTAMTGAENAGRDDAYHRAEQKGIPLTYQWLATLDNRTRHSHRHMHGQTKSGETYSNGCRYPGDPNGPAAEIWNCRCSQVAWVKGLERDAAKTSPKLGEMSYEEWLEAKPVYNPIKLPVEKAEAIKQAHIANYRKWSGGEKPLAIGGERGIMKLDQKVEFGSRRGWVNPDFSAKQPLYNGFEAFSKDDVLKSRIHLVEPENGYFDVAMHGAPDGVAFGTKQLSMTARELARVIKHDPDYDGQNVRLLSCNTGKIPESGECCVAEDLANALGVTVKAPDDLLFVQSNGDWYVGPFRKTELVEFSPNQRRRLK